MRLWLRKISALISQEWNLKSYNFFIYAWIVMKFALNDKAKGFYWFPGDNFLNFTLFFSFLQKLDLSVFDYLWTFKYLYKKKVISTQQTLVLQTISSLLTSALLFSYISTMNTNSILSKDQKRPNWEISLKSLWHPLNKIKLYMNNMIDSVSLSTFLLLSQRTLITSIVHYARQNYKALGTRKLRVFFF